MKQVLIHLIVIAVILSSCNQECEKVGSWHVNGKVETVYKYPNCSDTTTYEDWYYYDNGQKGGLGNVKNGELEGVFKSWNKDGVKTAQWYMKNGVEHGEVHCWYDNGYKMKEVTLWEGKANGVERIWHNDGTLRSVGSFSYGKKTGAWKFFDKTGSWKLRNYQDDILHGNTNEHIVDSIGNVILVVGQYESGSESGMWRWFDKDSILTKTMIYKKGKVTGEVLEYYKDGSIKVEGNLVNNMYDGELKYFDEQGKLSKVELYKEGRLFSSRKH